jgi:hypothetical protein
MTEDGVRDLLDGLSPPKVVVVLTGTATGERLNPRWRLWTPWVRRYEPWVCPWVSDRHDAQTRLDGPDLRVTFDPFSPVPGVTLDKLFVLDDETGAELYWTKSPGWNVNEVTIRFG